MRVLSPQLKAQEGEAAGPTKKRATDARLSISSPHLQAAGQGGYARPISSSTLRGDSSSSCSRSACSMAFSTLFLDVSWTSPP